MYLVVMLNVENVVKKRLNKPDMQTTQNKPKSDISCEKQGTLNKAKQGPINCKKKNCVSK